MRESRNRYLFLGVHGRLQHVKEGKTISGVLEIISILGHNVVENVLNPK